MIFFTNLPCRGVFKGGFLGSKPSFLGNFFNLLGFSRKNNKNPLKFYHKYKKNLKQPSKNFWIRASDVMVRTMHGSE